MKVENIEDVKQLFDIAPFVHIHHIRFNGFSEEQLLKVWGMTQKLLDEMVEQGVLQRRPFMFEADKTNFYEAILDYSSMFEE